MDIPIEYQRRLRQFGQLVPWCSMPFTSILREYMATWSMPMHGHVQIPSSERHLSCLRLVFGCHEPVSHVGHEGMLLRRSRRYDQMRMSITLARRTMYDQGDATSRSIQLAHYCRDDVLSSVDSVHCSYPHPVHSTETIEKSLHSRHGR